MSRASGFFESRFPLVRTQQTNRDERNLKLFTGHHGTIAGLRFGARDVGVTRSFRLLQGKCFMPTARTNCADKSGNILAFRRVTVVPEHHDDILPG
jgi:hypothetical protein